MCDFNSLLPSFWGWNTFNILKVDWLQCVSVGWQQQQHQQQQQQQDLQCGHQHPWDEGHAFAFGLSLACIFAPWLTDTTVGCCCRPLHVRLLGVLVVSKSCDLFLANMKSSLSCWCWHACVCCAWVISLYHRHSTSSYIMPISIVVEITLHSMNKSIAMGPKGYNQHICHGPNIAQTVWCFP